MFVEAGVCGEYLSKLFDGLSLPWQDFLLDMVEYAVNRRTSARSSFRTDVPKNKPVARRDHSVCIKRSAT